jgi:transposase
MDADLAALPDDVDALKAALMIERARTREVVVERDVGAAELAVARAKASADMALIAHQKLRIAKLERQIYGPRSERSDRLIDQLALQFEELEASATEDELRRGTRRCQDHGGDGVQPQAARTKHLPRASPPRARGDRSAEGL